MYIEGFKGLLILWYAYFISLNDFHFIQDVIYEAESDLCILINFLQLKKHLDKPIKGNFSLTFAWIFLFMKKFIKIQVYFLQYIIKQFLNTFIFKQTIFEQNKLNF